LILERSTDWASAAPAANNVTAIRTAPGIFTNIRPDEGKQRLKVWPSLATAWPPSYRFPDRCQASLSWNKPLNLGICRPRVKLAATGATRRICIPDARSSRAGGQRTCPAVAPLSHAMTIMSPRSSGMSGLLAVVLTILPMAMAGAGPTTAQVLGRQVLGRLVQSHRRGRVHVAFLWGTSSAAVMASRGYGIRARPANVAERSCRNSSRPVCRFVFQRSFCHLPRQWRQRRWRSRQRDRQITVAAIVMHFLHVGAGGTGGPADRSLHRVHRFRVGLGGRSSERWRSRRLPFSHDQLPTRSAHSFARRRLIRRSPAAFPDRTTVSDDTGFVDPAAIIIA
jgi:hypothetical protein